MDKKRPQEIVLGLLQICVVYVNPIILCYSEKELRIVVFTVIVPFLSPPVQFAQWKMCENVWKMCEKFRLDNNSYLGNINSTKQKLVTWPKYISPIVHITCRSQGGLIANVKLHFSEL